jgi:HAD superfamily hydrolase (TIGR01450 family)
VNTTHSDQLIQSYEYFLLDAYGVLVTSSGALPGAIDFLKELACNKRRYMVVTNDASRLPETAAAFYSRCGLEIPIDNIVTAGMAIGAALDELAPKRLKRCLVLGTSDTLEMVRRADHLVVDIGDKADFDALVVGDDSGFDFLLTMNSVLTALHRLALVGRLPALLLANSDLLYPKGSNAYGFTSGAAARLIEEGLRQLHPELTIEFEVLGKPARHIFELALRRLGSPDRTKVVMIGDQLHTDIMGANRCGISSALVASGVSQLPLPTNLAPEKQPRFVLRHL